MIKDKGNILIVAAHPDDEILGLGATMHKIINENNCTVNVVIIGEGITSRSRNRSIDKWKQELQIHKKNIACAAKLIGYNSINTYGLSDNRFDSIDLLDIIKIIEKNVDDFKPEYIFTHHGGDLNIDHQLTFQSVMTATRPLKPDAVKAIITFETPSSTEWQAFNHPYLFSPNLFFEISEDNMKAKILAMESYEFEKRSYPHPRSGEALKNRAKYWGNIISRKYAEAFCLIRYIQ